MAGQEFQLLLQSWRSFQHIQQQAPWVLKLPHSTASWQPAKWPAAATAQRAASGNGSAACSITSDAATQRVHLPQHLKDASLRKQASPRSNAYSSAVAQARAGFGGSGYAQSQQLAEATRPAGTYSEHVAQPMGGAKENLAHDEQVWLLFSTMQSLSS